MATVIRSARLSGEVVMLSVNQSGFDSAKRKNLGKILEVPMPAQASAAPATLSIPEQLQRWQAEKDQELAALKTSLLEKTKKIEERERLLQEELEGKRNEVREKAYAEGYQYGEAEAAKKYQVQLDGLKNLIDSSREEFSREIAGLEDVVVGIAFEAVCKILGKSMLEQDGVLAVVREVMGHAKQHEKLVLRVAPQDYEILFQNADLLFGERQDGRPEIVPDDRVTLGGCMVETSGGTLDGRLEIQLELLRETLFSARKMLPE